MNNSGDIEPQVNNVRQATFQYFREHPSFYVLFFAIAFAGSALTFYVRSPQFIFFSLAGLFVIYTIVSNKMRGYMMEQFAKSLNYSFEKEGDLNSVSGALFNIGHSQIMADVISGKDADGHPNRVFFYSYTVGSGKNSHTYNYTVFENTFKGNIPHILLHKQGFFTDTSLGFSNDNHVRLEGDFNKYFSLSVEKGFEMEAYEIFTPDFMEELIEDAKKLNFEFIDDKLYIYTINFIGSRDELQTMFDLSNKLCAHLEPVLKSIEGDVTAMKEVAK